MTLRLTILMLFIAIRGFAVDMITGTIAITNNPNGNTNTLTVNGSTRTWTNSITASPSTLIKETNTVTKAATNLLNHLSLYPPTAGGILGQTTASNVYIRALPGRSLTITVAGLWAEVTYSTQTVADATIVRVPITVEAATNQTNIASYLATALNLSTNAIATNATALSNFVTKGSAVGPQFIASELRLAGNLNNGTGNLSVSNLVNSGNALRSGGSGGNSLQIGSNALASGSLSAAIGNSATASATAALAVGWRAIASNAQAVAIGVDAHTYGDSASAIGYGAESSTNGTSVGAGATADGSGVAVGLDSQTIGYGGIAIGDSAYVAADFGIGIGESATVTHSNSVAIGQDSASSAANQLVLGSTVQTVDVPGVFAPSGTITNATFRGTNVLDGRLDYKPGTRTTLANGFNSATTLGTNVYLRMSGPSAAYTNAGFSASVDGTFHILQFDNPGLSYTILPESGLEATAANRVLTGTGALVNSTNNPAMVELLYDGAASRWRVLSIR